MESMKKARKQELINIYPSRTSKFLTNNILLI